MKKIGILTGGGDVPPLNTLIAAVQENAVRLGMEAIGFIKGWDGVLKKHSVPLSDIPNPSAIGGTVLKSSRTNIGSTHGGTKRVLENLHHLGVESLIVVGGEDTLSNAFLLKEFPTVSISKTIDNDVGTLDADIINYFTLGYPTAAERIVSIVSQKEGLRTTAYSHERIIIVEAMGMHAGWLALASGMGDPDVIIIPEFPLCYEDFLKRVSETYRKTNHSIIVIAEGARWSDGSFVHAENDEGQGFNHPRFGGSAATLAARMKRDLSGMFDIRNINAVNPSYIYRAGAPNRLDRTMAANLGSAAVRLIHEGLGEAMFLAVSKEEEAFGVHPVPLSRFASKDELHRFVDARFYDKDRFQISAAGRKYMSKIVREMPIDLSYGMGGPWTTS